MTLTSDDRRTAPAAYPGVEDRLLGDVARRETLEDYLQTGGYAAVAEVDSLLDDVDLAAVRGRGGAAFPISRKIQTVRSGADVPVVIANGEEGEPASVKDRWLLRHRPHLVLDGLRLASEMTGADRRVVYVSDDESARSVADALEEVRAGRLWDADVSIVTVPPTYVAGEETAAVRAVEGGPALPSDKPPRPFEEGVEGRPTMISNVETLANLPLVQRFGAGGYRGLGVAASPGTFLLTLGGCRAGGLYEVPFGVTLREVLNWLGEDTQTPGAYLVGGYFPGILGPRALDLPLDYDSLKGAGGGLGCGAVSVVPDTMCPVAVSAAVMAYFARENAGQCGSCFNGTAAMSAVLGALMAQRAEQADVDRLVHWSGFLRGRGACGTLDGATNVAVALLREFPGLVEDHLWSSCARCVDGERPSDPPFQVAVPPAGPGLDSVKGLTQ